MKTRLFIENKEVELNDDVQFLLNRQFEELSNPTVIINDWSKTVSLPFTEANNRLFGYIYKPERVIVDNGDPDAYKNMCVYFDPYKKLDFRLVYNEMTVMEGYAKMNSIKRNAESGTYDITLFGQLGKVFQEMKKITFDTTYDDSTYIINGAEYVDEYINKELVKKTWRWAAQTTPNIPKKGALGYNILNYIGFAPNDSFSEEFDYKTFQKDDRISDTFVSALESINFESSTGIAADTVLPDGLLPREIGEYRSYYQLPYIYWNKLVKIFLEKAEDITGYTAVLDSSFFNTSNPDWYNLVYMLKTFDVKKGETKLNTYTDIKHINAETLARWETSLNNYIQPQTGDVYFWQTIYEEAPVLENYRKININSHMSLDLTLDTKINVGNTGVPLSSANALIVEAKVTGENGHVETQGFLIVNGSSHADFSDCPYEQVEVGPSDSSADIYVPSLHYYFTLSNEAFGDYAYVTYEVKWKNNSYPSYGSTDYITYNILSAQSQLAIKVHSESWARSGTHFTLNTLWNNEYNIFEEVLKYCKKYRIMIYVDDFNKQIIFKQAKNYFSDYTIEDWTDKLDMSKDFIVTPVSFENKYVMFNYDESDTKLGKEYSEKYGVNYGEKRLTTDYVFNEETEELFDGCKTSILSSNNILSWTNLYEQKQVIFTFAKERSICCQDKDKKYVDVFGQYYYQNGIKDFDSHYTLLRPVKISDDTAFQDFNETYFYSQTMNYVDVSTYADLSLASGNRLCLFNTPQENYTYDSSLFVNKTSIYDRYWKNYIDERYNIQNKIVTCYLKISPKDYINFDFKNFVKINDVLYIVNKIYDYNIEADDSTKVDLVSIQDPIGYIN